MASINYNDSRFTTVENEKNAAITDLNNTYNTMINSSDKYYQDQIEAAKEYSNTQQQLQQANTDFAIEQVNQQKEQAKQDYTKEQTASYVDWQKQSNQYGVNAEQQAVQGLSNTGYSESSQVSMYNTYQNRISTARESYNRAVLNYDNAIKDAQLQNNAKLAEIAYQSLQTQLELSLQGFQYKNQLILEQTAQKQQLENQYYQRYQDVVNQINTENALAEQIRQYNENKAMEEKKYQESVRQYNASLAEQQRQANQDYQYKMAALNQAQAQWQAEYNLSKQNSSSSSSSINKSTASTSSVNKSTASTSSSTQTSNKYGNSTSTTKKSDYYFSNGYQPQYVNNTKLSASGLKVWNVFAEGSSEKNATTFGKQNIWKAGDKYYVWVGSSKEYVDVTKQVNGSQKNKVNYIWGR